MRFQSPVVRLAAACGLGLAVTSGLYVTMQSQMLNAPAEAVTPKITVLTVKRHIPAFGKITADDVVAKQVPSDVAPAGAISTNAQAVGRFVKQDIFPDEPLMDAKLFSQGQEYPTVLPLPAGKRAVTVAVNEVVGVAGFIGVGSLVDVIATMDLERKSVSRIILQNIQVLAAAQNKESADNPEAKIVSSVTLAVTPEESEQLTLATEKGTIRLAMRSPLENTTVKTEGETPSSLLGHEPPKPVAAKAPVKTATRTVTKTVVRTVEKPVRVAPPQPVDPGIMVIRGTNTSFINR